MRRNIASAGNDCLSANHAFQRTRSQISVTAVTKQTVTKLYLCAMYRSNLRGIGAAVCDAFNFGRHTLEQKIRNIMSHATASPPARQPLQRAPQRRPAAAPAQLAFDTGSPGLDIPDGPTLAERFRQLLAPWFGLSLAAAAVYVGWAGRDTRRIFADEGLGYALGIIGSVLILILLIYPLRKRVRLLKFIGPVRNWFKTHMTLGVVGPVAILYHCNFSLGSLNSRLALLSMLLVAGSGLVGRFLYSKIHHGLFGRRKHLKELLERVHLSVAGTEGATQFVPGLMKAIAAFDRQVLKPPKSIGESLRLPVRLLRTTRRGRREIMEIVALHLNLQEQRSVVVRTHRARLEKACERYVREHMRRVKRVAAFAAYERLFSLWHKIHLPFFMLLVVTASVHVIAVHFYAA